MAQALPRLYQTLSPAELSFGHASAQIGFNRRLRHDGIVKMMPNPDAHYETTTPILSVNETMARDFDGQPRMSPNWAGCLTRDLRRFSGRHASSLDRRIACTGGYVYAGTGDIKQGAQVGDQVGWIGDYDSVKALGVHLGQRVADALGDLQPIEGPLRAMSRTVAALLKVECRAMRC